MKVSATWTMTHYFVLSSTLQSTFSAPDTVVLTLAVLVPLLVMTASGSLLAVCVMGVKLRRKGKTDKCKESKSGRN